MRTLPSIFIAGIAAAGLAGATYGLDHEWKAVLKPGAGSTISGTAKVEEEGKGTEAEISIKGATAGAELPWHVHAGKCGDNGAIVGNDAAYPPLKVKNDGSAKAEAKLDIATPTAGAYYVNVHKSAAEPQTIVACGDLAMESDKAKTAGY